MNAWVFWPHFHGTNGQLQHQPPACSTLGVTNGICLLEHLTLRERFIVKDRFKLPPERPVNFGEPVRISTLQVRLPKFTVNHRAGELIPGFGIQHCRLRRRQVRLENP